VRWRDVGVDARPFQDHDGAIEAHLAFLARRCGLRLTEEYRVPAAGEWKSSSAMTSLPEKTPCGFSAAASNDWPRIQLRSAGPARRSEASVSRSQAGLGRRAVAQPRRLQSGAAGEARARQQSLPGRPVRIAAGRREAGDN
jgi:hypothetical protein